MVLIKSISGIRGTIGGNTGDGLSPVDISRFTAGYGMWIKRKYSGKKNESKKPEIVVGRDARISGKMVNKIVTGTLIGLGIDVLDIGLAATPTVEIAVTEEKAEGGIIITASHNPGDWNALKLLNRDGEFLSDNEGREIISIAEKEEFSFSSIEKLGILNEDFSYGDKHINKVINLSQVNIQAIQSAEIKVVIDGINSVGGLIIPALLRSLGVKDSENDAIKYDGQTLKKERPVYILLNKPKDYITTTDDPYAKKQVTALVKNACDERIYPVGRLDRMTTGVLLLTNDGDLAGKLTHPKFEKKKIYHVFLNKNLQKGDLLKIKDGLQLDDGLTKVDSIAYVTEDDKKQVGIEIHSGKNRVIRRIFEHLNYRVVRLDRVYFAGLTKKGLPKGKWRFLSEKEIVMLKMSAYK